MEQQPYPGLPAHVVCPRDEEGHSWTIHKSHLLPIGNSLGQAEDENPLVRVESIDKPTPMPPADNGLLANGPTES